MYSNDESNFVPAKLYNQIMKLLPIASVEAVIKINDSFLLLRRKNKPAKGEWWFPGGIIKKDESLKQALHREVKEETALQVSTHKLINVYSRVFPERHDITVVHLCKCKKGEIALNDE
jgi:ADP-ribose pyrophosphatase YjhB (NUDIX family)